MRTLFLAALLTLFGFSPACPANAQSPAATPLSLGVTETVHSNLLGENRTLNIYLPEGYSKSTPTRYPVIYLLDGGTNEDFIHVAGLVQFCAFKWVHYLPPSIVVGIANTDRQRDFTPPSSVAKERKMHPTSGKSAVFRNALETELIPFVERHYPTSGERTLVGESLGGLLATEILLKQPTLFRNYIIVSPSLWWSDGVLLQDRLKTLSAQLRDTTHIWIAVGKEGLAPTATPHVMEVDANVLADQLQALKNPLLQVRFDYLPAENHATIFHQALLNAFQKGSGR